MKPQHELLPPNNNNNNNIDGNMDFVFASSSTITSPGFHLSVWGEPPSESLHSFQTKIEHLPFAFPDNDDDDAATASWMGGCEDDDDDDDSNSDCWSIYSSEEYSNIDSTFHEEHGVLDGVLDSLMAEDDDDNRARKVRFHPSLVSCVQVFEKVGPEYSGKLYYTAHELQRMVDDFVAQGGTKLLSSSNDQNDTHAPK